MPAQNPVYPQGKNRILDLLLYFTELESQHRVNDLAANKFGPAALELREKFLVNTIDAFKKTQDLELTPAERETRTFLRHELRKTRALQKPTLLKRIIFNRWVNRRLNNLIGRKAIFRNHDKMILAYEAKTALAVNAANLQNELRELGFRGQMEEPLKRMMAGNLKEFAFPHFDITRLDTKFDFHIKKMPGSDAYFLEKFVASHRQTKQEVLRGEQPIPSFTVNLKNDIHFDPDQARIIAAGKGVNKDALTSKNWFFPDYSANGLKIVEYDLSKDLDRFAIQEMRDEPGKNKLIKALANGEQIEVSLPLSQDQLIHIKVEMTWNRYGNPHLTFRSLTGELLHEDHIPRNIDIFNAKAMPVTKELDKVESQATTTGINKLMAMHEQYTASKETAVSPNLQAAAETHARIQSSKENVGPYVLRPVRY